jgi:DNA-binding NtrC family response regulator
MQIEVKNNQEEKNKFSIVKEKTGLRDLKKEAEKDAIINTLKKFNGDCQRSAEYLGISLRTLYYKIQKYRIKKQYNYKSD